MKTNLLIFLIITFFPAGANSQNFSSNKHEFNTNLHSEYNIKYFYAINYLNNLELNPTDSFIKKNKISCVNFIVCQSKVDNILAEIRFDTKGRALDAILYKTYNTSKEKAIEWDYSYKSKGNYLLEKKIYINNLVPYAMTYISNLITTKNYSKNDIAIYKDSKLTGNILYYLNLKNGNKFISENSFVENIEKTISIKNEKQATVNTQSIYSRTEEASVLDGYPIYKQKYSPKKINYYELYSINTDKKIYNLCNVQYIYSEIYPCEIEDQTKAPLFLYVMDTQKGLPHEIHFYDLSGERKRQTLGEYIETYNKFKEVFLIKVTYKYFK